MVPSCIFIGSFHGNFVAHCCCDSSGHPLQVWVRFTPLQPPPYALLVAVYYYHQILLTSEIFVNIRYTFMQFLAENHCFLLENFSLKTCFSVIVCVLLRVVQTFGLQPHLRIPRVGNSVWLADFFVRIFMDSWIRHLLLDQ